MRNRQAAWLLFLIPHSSFCIAFISQPSAFTSGFGILRAAGVSLTMADSLYRAASSLGPAAFQQISLNSFSLALPSSLMDSSLLLATYGTVFLAELVGDKNLYTISTLVVRFEVWPVVCGVALAFAGKMLAAVLLGQAIAALPSRLVTGMSAATFFLTGLMLWMKKPGRERPEGASVEGWTRALPVSFAAVFFSEWGDVGQIAAATLVARFHAPLVVWTGATLALLTKGLLALTLGAGLARRLPRNVLRYGALAVCLTLGFLSLLRID